MAGTLADVRIEGVQVHGFDGGGLFATDTQGLTVARSAFAGNGDYALAADRSADTTIADVLATGNRNGGLHFSRDQQLTVRDSVARRNHGEGIFVGDTTSARIEGNTLSGNCAGIVAIDTGEPGAASGLTIVRNTLASNNLDCAPAAGSNGEAGRPPEHGLGLALAGTTQATVTANQITGNHGSAGAPGGPPQPAGGLLLISSAPFGGQDPACNQIHGNTIQDNTPLDVLSDGSGSHNTFAGNHCGTGNVPGLC